ncbi:ABC-F family ATP-binding cassette domain-containing protein [Sphingomonas sp. G-3-2-10]|uniref:ABC-F family ATP-binding cassette domain-containing protein n=1 Tax=Sphingomonas sp. G-3-2-10 TaxID=2728838 RepID=UPI00146B4C83|nr:ABC-F family ATP-binding cassette domain-containing protein [Sphingomonas sp. G-3-2-10]NML04747.1 ABC-F family ATP-binding cassette domain-containing protein [Sphingomonas sp. G-3-2-10]
MSAITLSNLSWSTPDGVPLLTDLDLGFSPERTGLVGRNGVGKTTLLRLIAGDLAPQSGKVSVNGTLATLRQSLAPQPGETIATLFGVGDALALLRRAEAGDATMEELAEADWTLEARIESALAQFRLDVPLDTPLTALSGGQRTRAALAAAVLAEPDFLLLDEPTNNLDRDGRDAVLSLLAGWRAGAIVVSHDRELLDTMDAIVELTGLGATRYGGNWTAYRERKALELAAARHDLADAERRVGEAARTAQQQAERKARRDGAGKRKAAKGDMPRIILGMMKNRAENSSGEAARLAERQRSEARDAASAAREKIEILQPLTVTLPPSGLPANRNVLELHDVTTGYDRPILSSVSLSLNGPERVAISGPNGSGKSTLLALVTGRLAAWSGTVRVTDRIAMLDQQASILDPAASIHDNFARLNPGATENACRAALARFAFRADAALQIAGTLSGGQRLRAALACTLGGETPPWLLILDEPTNHLDIDSIEAVEAGLIAYDGALLVVSHDAPFLEAIGIERQVELG